MVVSVLGLTWLIGFSIGEIPDEIAVGMVAPYDIRADRQYAVVDEAATEERRIEALQQARPVYDYDTEAAVMQITHLSEAFTNARLAWAGAQASAGGEESTEWLANLRRRFEEQLGQRVSDAQWEAFVALQWGYEVERAITAVIEQLTAGPVVANVEPLQQEREHGILLRTVTVVDGKRQMAEETIQGAALDRFTGVDPLRTEMKMEGLGRQSKPIREFVASLLQPNCSINLLETEARRSKIVQSISLVTETVKAGEMIVRRYEPYTEHQVHLLRSIQAQKEAGRWPIRSMGHLLYIALVLLLLHHFGSLHLHAYRPVRRDLVFLGAFLLVAVLILRAGGLLSEALATGLPLAIPRGAYYYLIPLATGGMMVRFLLNAEIAVMVSLAIAAFAGILFSHDSSFTAYVFLVNIAGAATMGHVDKRSSMIRAGGMTGAVAIVAVAAIHLMRAGTLGEPLSVHTLVWHMVLAFGGAVFSAFVVMALTPAAETLFDYTSDIKLLELANLNHPLLRELVIRAPGTYHHSHLVGILAEAGAAVIGAHALLARVSAYYHDIGKIRKSMYFTENQKGISPHDRLSPHMSALIIASHVKEGIELARTYKLPRVIIDMIPQHHGTKRIGYFYERAKELADPALEIIDEKAFRYAGPKPQTREAGLLLLADGIEGAVRALKEKTPIRIQQTVQSMLNKSFAEGQLDECELTLQNLHDIGKSFSRILLGIYHQRVEYPREVMQLKDTDISVVDPQESDETLEDPNPPRAPHARST
ncbi:MAG: HDIG domain-containing protein [Deltaproteobacteria bacterium]|nr:HDIG domain-containing protein [Deltaproteobacteria bacterium]